MKDNNKVEGVDKFETNLKYNFKSNSLLIHALSHTSYTNERGMDKSMSNERLEFLGDAIVDMIVSEYLYHEYPTEPEGVLSRIRAAVVCEQSFASIANSMDFGKYILLGKGEDATGGRHRNSVLADSFEAVVAAMYLDSDIKNVTDWVMNHLKQPIKEAVLGHKTKDYKTILQEMTQKDNLGKVAYDILNEYGPDHAKVFEMQVSVGDKVLATGRGTSKKDAEQAAAGAAIDSLKKS